MLFEQLERFIRKKKGGVKIINYFNKSYKRIDSIRNQLVHFACIATIWEGGAGFIIANRIAYNRFSPRDWQKQLNLLKRKTVNKRTTRALCARDLIGAETALNKMHNDFIYYYDQFLKDNNISINY